MEFTLKEPPINIGSEISIKSFETIEKEIKNFKNFKRFNREEGEVVKRLIHTTACFREVIEGIFFTKNGLEHTKNLLLKKAKIIVDTNMIKSGISQFYTKKYENEVICYINEDFIFKKAKEENTTRSYAAVKYAIKRFKDSPLVICCGNAPTFIYAAINTIIKNKIDPKNISLLIFPVGFVNVIESKEYAMDFLKYFNAEGIVMRGRFGSSTMVVAALHAIYKLIKDYDGTSKYNGK